MAVKGFRNHIVAVVLRQPIQTIQWFKVFSFRKLQGIGLQNELTNFINISLCYREERNQTNKNNRTRFCIFKILVQQICLILPNNRNMESPRQKKIGALLQQEIAQLLQGAVRKGCEQCLDLGRKVTTVDLSIAKVYLSLFPSKTPMYG